MLVQRLTNVQSNVPTTKVVAVSTTVGIITGLPREYTYSWTSSEAVVSHVTSFRLGTYQPRQNHPPRY